MNSSSSVSTRKKAVLDELFWIRIGLLPLLSAEKQQEYYNYLFDIHADYARADDCQGNYETAKKAIEQIKIDLAGFGVDVEREAIFAQQQNSSPAGAQRDPWDEEF
jgi:hypothetical protein